MSGDILKLKAHEKALVEFIEGPAHAGYVEARKRELLDVREAILGMDPVRREDEIEQYKLRGEMRVLENLIENFPNALEDLRERISDLEDEANTRK
jgi:hypothetical protein